MARGADAPAPPQPMSIMMARRSGLPKLTLEPGAPADLSIPTSPAWSAQSSSPQISPQGPQRAAQKWNKSEALPPMAAKSSPVRRRRSKDALVSEGQETPRSLGQALQPLSEEQETPRSRGQALQPLSEEQEPAESTRLKQKPADAMVSTRRAKEEEEAIQAKLLDPGEDLHKGSSESTARRVSGQGSLRRQSSCGPTFYKAEGYMAATLSGRHRSSEALHVPQSASEGHVPQYATQGHLPPYASEGNEARVQYYSRLRKLSPTAYRQQSREEGGRPKSYQLPEPGAVGSRAKSDQLPEPGAGRRRIKSSFESHCEDSAPWAGSSRYGARGADFLDALKETLNGMEKDSCHVYGSLTLEEQSAVEQHALALNLWSGQMQEELVVIREGKDTMRAYKELASLRPGQGLKLHGLESHMLFFEGCKAMSLGLWVEPSLADGLASACGSFDVFRTDGDEGEFAKCIQQTLADLDPHYAHRFPAQMSRENLETLQSAASKLGYVCEHVKGSGNEIMLRVGMPERLQEECLLKAEVEAAGSRHASRRKALPPQEAPRLMTEDAPRFFVKDTPQLGSVADDGERARNRNLGVQLPHPPSAPPAATPPSPSLGKSQAHRSPAGPDTEIARLRAEVARLRRDSRTSVTSRSRLSLGSDEDFMMLAHNGRGRGRSGQDDVMRVYEEPRPLDEQMMIGDAMCPEALDVYTDSKGMFGGANLLKFLEHSETVMEAKLSRSNFSTTLEFVSALEKIYDGVTELQVDAGLRFSHSLAPSFFKVFVDKAAAAAGFSTNSFLQTVLEEHKRQEALRRKNRRRSAEFYNSSPF